MFVLYETPAGYAIFKVSKFQNSWFGAIFSAINGDLRLCFVRFTCGQRAEKTMCFSDFNPIFFNHVVRFLVAGWEEIDSSW